MESNDKFVNSYNYIDFLDAHFCLGMPIFESQHKHVQICICTHAQLLILRLYICIHFKVSWDSQAICSESTALKWPLSISSYKNVILILNQDIYDYLQKVDLFDVVVCVRVHAHTCDFYTWCKIHDYFLETYNICLVIL